MNEFFVKLESSKATHASTIYNKVFLTHFFQMVNHVLDIVFFVVAVS